MRLPSLPAGHLYMVVVDVESCPRVHFTSCQEEVEEYIHDYVECEERALVDLQDGDILTAKDDLPELPVVQTDYYGIFIVRQLFPTTAYE